MTSNEASHLIRRGPIAATALRHPALVEVQVAELDKVVEEEEAKGRDKAREAARVRGAEAAVARAAAADGVIEVGRAAVTVHPEKRGERRENSRDIGRP